MDFWFTMFVTGCIRSIAVLGLFLQARSGQLNIGMAVFVGVGGYMSGVTSTTYGLPIMVSIPLAILSGIVFGSLFSILTLRLNHWFFAVTTLVLSMAAVSGIGAIEVAGGSLGLVGIPLFGNSVPILVGLALALAVVIWVDRSSVGLAIRATGDDPTLSEIFGIRVQHLRVAIFGLGSGIAALAGALQAHRFGLYQPSDLGIEASLFLIIALIVGGKNNVWGPLLGTMFLVLAPEVIPVAPEAQLMLFGAMLVAIILVAPDGIAGFIKSAVGWKRKSMPKIEKAIPRP